MFDPRSFRPSPADATNVASAVFPTATEAEKGNDVREPDFLPYLSGKITKNLGMKPTSTMGNGR